MRSYRSHSSVDLEQLPDEEQRQRMKKALAESQFVPFMALGPLFVRVQAVSDSLVYEVFSSSFPQDRQRVAVVLDAPEPGTWGKLKQVWFGNGRGYKRYGVADLNAESHELLKWMFKRLHELATATLHDSLAASSIADSRQAAERRIMQKRARVRAAEDMELAQLLLDIASKESPTGAAEAVALSDVFAQITPVPAPLKDQTSTPEQKASGQHLLAATPSP